MIENILTSFDQIIHQRILRPLIAPNRIIFNLLGHYIFPFISGIDELYHPPLNKEHFPFTQPQVFTSGRVTTSVIILTINNTTNDNIYLHKRKTRLLIRVQPLQVSFGTNNTSNSIEELLARILALKVLLLYVPAIIIYESQVVHDLHHNFISTVYIS